jgi:hypothetical protein
MSDFDFSDPIECYQAMGVCLSNAATEAWDRMEVDATLDGNQVDLVVGCWRADRAEAAYLTEIPRLGRYVYELARLVSTEEKGFFKKCFFTLHKDGTFRVDFAY